MILSTSAGVLNSYNSGKITGSSYSNFINGFKFNIEEYGTSSPAAAFLLFDLYLDYLVINDEIIVGGTVPPVQLGSFDESLADVTYRDDGYGLGNAVIVDMLNNYNYFAKNDIIFYPGNANAGANGFTLKTREKTRVVAVFRDYWDLTGGEVTWTLFMNYPWTNLNSNKELFIADAIGDATAGFDNKDLNSVSESLFTW
jgi:hypothetical protein